LTKNNLRRGLGPKQKAFMGERVGVKSGLETCSEGLCNQDEKLELSEEFLISTHPNRVAI
jgi:hypothetical protein